ncbi:D-glycerate dehydrogenase [Heliobacterium gestii]|uniref:D-glycerate dehydrogenase n=1 Tax=Heliomicrobium gestii TaxID=2699 RepID=A0A845LC13_HELGE|nr:D-glycerate dehydrogenase [Heliomicrobium gestii]MBM7866341.1 glyoxylate reductase [Heliomicrobium gestii]MZP42874.1 D-glycerate dehydrogenase [Heliomicrobium gestii]
MNPTQRPKVLVTREIPQPALDRIKEFARLDLWPAFPPPEKSELLRMVGDADALLSMLTDPIDEDVIAAGKNLRVIANYAVGFDNIDVAAATRHGIAVTNTPDVLTEATADLAFTLLMAAARNLIAADRFTRDGFWIAWHPQLLLGQDVFGATLGIVGLGRIGEAVARRARGFNMRVLYTARRRNLQAEAELGLQFCSLEELLRQSDYVSLHMPLTAETRHLIGAEELAMMKPTAILINTARGGVVDQAALTEALQQGTIGGAGLDVFAVEPVNPEEPLLELPNVVVAPHIGSATVETRTRMGLMAVENIQAVFEGRRPPNLVNGELFA